MKKYLCIVAMLFLSSLSYADTIILKSGKTIEGEIIEKTDEYIKLEFDGMPVTYFLDDVDSIDAEAGGKSHFEKLMRDAQISSARADMAGIATALTIYKLDNGIFPTTEQGLAALMTKPEIKPLPVAWSGPYMVELPSLDPWKNPYNYTCPAINNLDEFDLLSFGPDGVKSDDDITTWN